MGNKNVGMIREQHSEIFLILLLILLLSVVMLTAEIEKSEQQTKSQSDISPEEQIAQLKQTIETQEEQLKRQKKPPIITLPEASGFSFATGRAELSPSFISQIEKDIVPQLESITKEFDVNVIEIVGHTDGQRINGAYGSGNLDSKLEDVAYADDLTAVKVLVPQSNADLGLMRALSVTKYIQKKQQTGLLKGITIRPYSAGQILMPNGRLSPVNRTSDPTRRRIEIRFTKL